MNKFGLFIILLFASFSTAQVRMGTGPIINNFCVDAANCIAILPQVWADDHECDPPGGIFDVVKTIPGDYAIVNAQQANVDWAAAPDQWWHVVVTHGSVLPPLTMLAKVVGGGMPTKCIVWDSDTPLPAGVVVCNHGFQDNIPTSIDIGLRNPDCNGSVITFQLGQILATIPPGPFTLANGTATNSSAYNDVASMFTVECNTVNCTSIQGGSTDVNGNGPNHFAIYNFEARVNLSRTCCFPIAFFNSGSTVASLPSHYHLDRFWTHSDATDAGTGTQSLTDGLRINCGGNCSASNFSISKIIRPGAEGHGVFWADAQQLKLVHYWIEGTSISVMSGGLTTSVPGGPSGRDIEIRRFRHTYPLPWLGHGTGASSVCGANINCVRKNCLEQKGVQRIVVDGGICENVDNSGGQNGTLSDFNNRACTPNTCDNYAQTIQNVTITNTIFRHGCGGLLFDANSGNPGSSGNSPTTPGRNFLLQNALLYDISAANFNCGINNNYTFYLGGANHDFAVTSVTRNAAGTISHIVLTGGPGELETGLVAGDPITLEGCTDTSFNAGPYPFVYALTVSGDDITYPNLGTALATTTCTVFNPGAGWPNYVTVDHVTAVGDMTIGMGSNVSGNKTWPRNATYKNSIFTGAIGFTTAGQTDGTFFENGWFDVPTLSVHDNLFSQRNPLTWTALTTYKLGQIVKPTGSPLRNFVVVTSGTSGASAPAWNASQFACVTDGTITWQEISLQAATFSGMPDYTQYKPIGVATHPPTTLYFPMTDFTYGATADGTSIGFQGSMNSPLTGTNTCVPGTQVKGINVALDFQDWHNYALHSSSVFRNKADNGTDLGVNLSNIDAAQTSTKYVCHSACGAGPTQD